MTGTSSRRAIEGYVSALEEAKADSIEGLLDLCAENIEFRDPFNHTRTKPEFKQVLQHMFQQVKQLRFDVHEVQGEGAKWFLKWTFTGRVRVIGALEIDGVTEVDIDQEGLVCRHLDYWDATGPVLLRLPVLGKILWLLTKPMRI